MGRGFESHRGHGIERQVVNKKAIWLFCCVDHWLSPCGANANYANYVNDVTGTPATSQVVLTQVLHLSHASEGVPREKLTVIFLNS